MITQEHSLTRTVLLAMAFASLWALSADAATTYTWTQTGTGTYPWSAGGNWSAGAPPLGGASTAEVQFFASTATVIPNAAAVVSNNDLGTGSPSDFDLNILTLNGKGPATTAAGVTVQGADLNFISNGATTPVVNLNGVNGSKTLTYSVNNNLKFANDMAFQGDGTATFTFAGTVSGVGNLAKSGLSTMSLGGTNTSWTGKTTITGGAVSIATDGNLGQAPASPVADQITLDGGALTIAAASTLTLNANRGITLGTGGGTINLTTAGGTLAYGGVIAGTGRLTYYSKSGNANITGVNSYSGGTTLIANQANTGNRLYLSSDAGLGAVPASADATNITLAQTLGTPSIIPTTYFAVSPTRGMTISGAQVMIDGGSSTSMLYYDGVITGSASQVQYQNYAVLGGASTFTGQSILWGGVSVTAVSDAGQPGPLGAPTGANATISLGNGTNSGGNLKYVGTGPAGHSTDRKVFLADRASAASIEASGVGPLSFTNTASDFFTTATTLTGTPSLTLKGTGVGSMAGGMDIRTAGALVPLTKSGTGTWTLGGPISYTVGTSTTYVSVTGGILQLNNSGALPTPALSISVASGATLALGYAGGPNQTLLGKVQTAAAGTIALATDCSNNLDFSTAGLTGVSLGAVGAASYTGTLTPNGTTYRLGGGGGTLTLPNANTLTGTNGVVISGSGSSGTVVYGASQNYSGTTTINAGTLQTDASMALGNALTLGGVATTATPTLATGAQTVTLGGDVTYSATGNGPGAVISGNLDLGGVTRTFTIGDSTATTTDTTVSAVISNGSLTKAGAGTMVLTGANSYTGATTVSAGVLQANDSAGLPGTGSTGGGSNLVFAGGMLQGNGSSPVTFSRAMGTSAGQVQWALASNGGFAAGDAKMTVNIGGNSTPDTLVWGGTSGPSQYFIRAGQGLLLNSATSTAELEFKNNIDLNGALRTITGTDNLASGTDFITLSGTISNGTLGLSGGTFKLTGANTFTQVEPGTGGGVIEAVEGTGLPTNCILKFANAGVLQSHGTFTRALGTASGKVWWSSSGGFSAAGGKFTINLGGNSTPDTLTWGSGSFVPAGSNLVFGSVSADSEVEFRNNVDLNNAAHSIFVNDNLFSSGDFATVSGVLSSTTPASGALTKSGAGTLKFTGANSYAGATTISAGVLQAQDGGGLPNGSNVNGGSNLTFGGNAVAAVFQSTDTFSRSLGTGQTGVQWTAARNGGFAAGDSKLTVNLSSGAALTWNSTAQFVTTGTLTFGSTTSAAEVEFQNAIDLNGAARTIQVDDNPTTTADFTTFSGSISNGSLTKTGAGTLRLTANNDYTGTTTVSLGTLLVNGTTAGQDNYSVTATAPGTGVAGGATVGGTGTIGLAVGKTITLTGLDAANYAALSPGASVGTLNIIGDVFMNNYSRLVMEINGAASDRLNLTGSLFANSAGNLDTLYLVSGLAGMTLPSYTLVDYSSTFYGTFDQVYFNGNLIANPTGSAGNIGGYQLVYGPLNNGELTLVQVGIPEPASVILLGLAGLLGLGRRRR